jgi:outer membrane lipoprotein-sorting protein
MDALSKGFLGVEAELSKVSYTFVIKDMSEESGHLTLFRAKPHDTRMLIEFTKPEPRAVSYANERVEILYPKRNVVEVYNLGRESRLIEQFLLLGFGSSSAELKRNYSIQYKELASLAGVKADHLELTPKSREAQEHVSTIELWIVHDGGYPLRLRLNRPAKDYDEVTYSAVHVNPSSLNEASVRLKAKGVPRINPQK